MRALFLIPIKLYQWLISPLLGNNCRHIPSCSEYTFEAIQEHGVSDLAIGLALPDAVKEGLYGLATPRAEFRAVARTVRSSWYAIRRRRDHGAPKLSQLPLF